MRLLKSGKKADLMKDNVPREGTPADGGGFNRRNLLKVSTILGGGGLISQTLIPAKALAQQPAQSKGESWESRRHQSGVVCGAVTLSAAEAAVSSPE